MPPSRKANIKLGNPSTDTKPRMFKITAIKIDKINPLTMLYILPIDHLKK